MANKKSNETLTEERIKEKIKTHGENLQQLDTQRKQLLDQRQRIDNQLVGILDQAKSFGGAIRELQDLEKELQEADEKSSDKTAD